MQVLLLTQVLPYPPDSGPKVKTWNVIKYLAQNHEVTLVSFVRGDQSAEVEKLREYCTAVHTVPMERNVVLDGLAMARSFLTGKPWMMVRDDRKAMRELIDRLAAEKQFDIVHADQLNMGQFALRVPGARTVMDAHNALWLLYKRLWETMGGGVRKVLLGRDWKLLKTYEGWICREFDAVLAVSDEDKLALEEAMGVDESDICVIPIAVDTDEEAYVERNPEADHILHIGTMFWPPNIDGVTWFLDEIYPLIRVERLDAVFDLVGSRPPEALVELGAQDAGINVTGYVEDPAEFYTNTGVMIVPLRAGGGMRVKILNALSQGLPLVSTSLGAEGIGVVSGEHLLLADQPADFAQAVLQLLEDKTLATTLGQNGRNLIKERYDYRTACQPLDQIYLVD
ncbi:MAG: glycosyltransferase [Anaerolineales bacterium]|nr:glycosyltransferase [Anaerolineales bacterium]